MSDFPLLSEQAKMLREANVGGANLAPIDFETIAVMKKLEGLEENFDQAFKGWARLSELVEHSYDFTEYCSFCQRVIGEHAEDCKLVAALFPVAIADAHPDQPLPR